MSLYNRNYTQEREVEQTYAQSNLSAFIKQTYQLFAASLLAATAGAYTGIYFLAATLIQNKFLFWGIVIVEFITLFALMAAKRKAGLNLILLFAFTFMSGLTLTPLLYAILGMPSGAAIVAQAFTLTTVAFGGLSIFAMNTKRDFTTMGKMLFIALIVVIVASLINIFTQSPMFQLVIASISAILFSAYILYDTQNIIRGNYETPVEGAVALYLDFVNLFTSLLQILGIFGRDE
ncbi:Bax inhibitor-1/YccA family protein [Campylobacter gastrosuis]|uniref:Bax inhibitor-1/YccA family protein n=1 Tax=Campylobacter gastrosuis TaxID=2974576 RepID=A0ABT7HQZ8_9BACT|nr:Bax inhibitor-1/YccA family protein [Campylobacter gastrosuis]MDL0089290.1 Bax inhibitor-1/YccA family protein [Campylobacter gastrosuis]